jgi:hypothetical protein
LKLSKLSAKYFLASYITGSATTQVNSAPVVRLSAASSSYHNTYTTGGSAVVIAGPASTITDSDGTMLASMTATITNLQDGAAEVLTVGASNTLISSSYGNGVLTLSGVASLSDYQKLLRSITYNNSAVAPTAGVRTITVVANDGIVNSAAATSSITVSVGATNYSIKANDATVNASEASAFGFTFTNAEVGATYEYTITSSGGGTPVTGNGTVASANQQVTNIDVSQLTDGTLTVSVTLTDTDNHVGNAVTATAKLDTTVTGTIAANSTLVNASEASAFKFTFAGAEVGATYTYTIASSGGGSVTGNGTIATATDLVTKDISSLLDGTLTITVVLTDAAGNTKTVTDTTATLDKTAPTVTVNQASTQSDPTNDSPIYFTVTFSEVVTGFDANDVTVVGISGTPSIVVTDSGDGKTYNVAVSGMVDGETVTVTVAAGVVTDTAGNANAASTSTDNSVTCDTAAPTGYSITANDDTVNASESTSFGFTFADAEVGATYTYTITSSGGGTPVTGTGVITAADQQVTGINLSGLENGTLTISVTLTDPAGNAGAAAETTATLDMTV